jgi:transketolase
VHGPDYRFQPGKIDVLAEGEDVAILATGGTVGHAMSAREQLAVEGIDAAVINVHTIKPIDREGLLSWAGKVPLMVSVEDHNVLGGMGGAVAEVLAEKSGGARLHRHGILDVFGESGETEDLYRKFRLDAEGIASVVRAELAR